MNRLYLLLIALTTMLFTPATLFAQDNHEGEEAPELFFTQINSNVEAYLGIAALVKGSDTHFHVNLTDITTYKPILNAKMSVTIGSFTTKEAVSKDGVYHFGAKIENPGEVALSAKVEIDGKVLLFDFGTIKVYDDLHEAIEENEKPENKDEVSLSKKYMWNMDFGVEIIKIDNFDYIIKTSGEILPAISSEAVIVAPTSGVVNYNSRSVAGNRVERGGVIAVISSGSLENNLSSRYERLKSEYESAKQNYERDKELLKDKIVSEKSYRESYDKYILAKETFENLSKLYTKNGVVVSMPSVGTISQILIPENQYVEAGTPIAKIQFKKENMLKINISKFNAKDIKNIYDANFVPEYIDRTLTVSSLGGAKLSQEISTVTKSAYIPLYFSLPLTEEVIPHSFATVYAKARATNDVISVPSQALLENEGIYWVYVQIGGEKFMKRDVTIGKSDGKRTIITSGLRAGDIVVTNGAVKVRQAENSGAELDHGHSH